MRIIIAIALAVGCKSEGEPTKRELNCSRETDPVKRDECWREKKKQADATRPPQTSPATQSLDASVVVEITAGKLYAEYQADEAGAKAKYRDRELRVAGIVARTGKDYATQKPFVALQVAGGDKELRAIIATSPGVDALKPRQEVSMRCRGGSSLGLPTLEDCVLE